MRKRRPKVCAAHKMAYDGTQIYKRSVLRTANNHALALFERELNKLRHFDFHIISIRNIQTAYTHTTATTVRFYGTGT